MSTEVETGLVRLAQRLHGAQATVSSATRLTSGANLETWAFDVRAPAESANSRTHEYILRRRSGESGASSIDLDVEAALIQAATRHGVLAPPLIHLCDAVDGLGAAHVTRRIAGESLGRKIASHAQFDAVRPQLARQCGEQLARIHATSVPTPLPL